MRVHVTVINYRTPELTLRAVASVLDDPEALPDTRVAIVENDSRDGSLAKIEAAVDERGWAHRVTVSPSERNGGFSYGVNRGVRLGLASDPPPDYLYLLNSDARVEPGAIARLVRFLDAHPEAGIAGSYIFGPDGETHGTAFRFPGLASNLEAGLGIGVVSRLLARFVVSMPVPREDTPVDWLAGASMMIRRALFDEVGFFDENFFLYFEETDYCLRARRAGWSTWYVPASRVEHVGAASTGWKDFSKPRSAYWFEGRRYYLAKSHGRPYLWAANGLWLLGHAVWWLRAGLQRKPDVYPPHFLRDFLRHNLTFRPLPRPRAR